LLVVFTTVRQSIVIGNWLHIWHRNLELMSACVMSVQQYRRLWSHTKLSWMGELIKVCCK